MNSTSLYRKFEIYSHQTGRSMESIGSEIYYGTGKSNRFEFWINGFPPSEKIYERARKLAIKLGIIPNAEPIKAPNPFANNFFNRSVPISRNNIVAY